MKTIIKSVFLVAILALVVTGCQKEGDDLNVSLKSTIAFTGGIYISPWQSGDAEFECGQAGGCDGGSYKMDQGVYAGSSFNGGGVTVTGISKQEFSWTSIYPVCKIIVKAGNGAYIFNIDGAQSGSVPYPKELEVKEKDISHITFCFGKDVVALKIRMYRPYECETGTCYDYGYAVMSGDLYPFTNCGYSDILGVSNYDNGDTFDLRRLEGLENEVIGSVLVTDDDEVMTVAITLSGGWLIGNVYFYYGPLSGLAPFNTCPAYTSWPYTDLGVNSSTTNLFIPLD